MAATAAEPRPAAVIEEPLSAKILRVLAKAPLQIVLVIIGLFWLVPTIGLFIISLLDPADLASNGWWTFLTKPSQLTLDNYRAIFENESITSSLWTTLWIAIGGTVLPIFVARARRLRVRLARLPGPRLASSSLSSRCSSCRCRWR